MGQSNILVVDDEPTQRQLICRVLENKLGYVPIAMEGGQQAIDYVISAQSPQPEAILLDLSMPEVSGMDVIRKLRPLCPNLPIIVLTIYGDIEKAVAAMKAGATDFLAKPVAHERLRTSINNALKINALSEEVNRLRRSRHGKVMWGDIIGESPALRKARDTALRAADSSVPILLEGESGVGKELFARAIHSSSDRSDGPFVAVNCGAIAGEVAESMLFGREQRTADGNAEMHSGKFQEADGGTLFLDEVSALSAEVQVKLLRVLQEYEVQPVGASKGRKVNVRIISSTNKDLENMLDEGSFREDLFYRLAGFPIHIPPLRSRRTDVALLANEFVKRFCVLENRPARELSEDSLQLLTNYDWPGNIRQLESLIFRLVLLSDQEMVTPCDMQHLLPTSYIRKFNVNDNMAQTSFYGGSLTLLAEGGNIKTLRALEAHAIHFALRYYEGKISTVARQLGIGRSTLYRKMQELGINPSQDFRKLASGS
jgi:DNA-binding NtrC family response regulator